jgi:hypothetical protein
VLVLLMGLIYEAHFEMASDGIIYLLRFMNTGLGLGNVITSTL